MNRSYFVIILTATILISGFLYYRYASETYILNSEGFSKDDILIKEEYPLYDDESASVFLLADSVKLGLIVSVENKWGLWSSKLRSIANNPADEQLVTVGFAKTAEETIDIESHMMVAYYVDHPFNVESPAEYDLTVEFIPVNDRMLMFAHAISNGKSSLSSVEIVSYLETYYK